LTETSNLSVLWREIAGGKTLVCIGDTSACVSANEVFGENDTIGANVTTKMIGGLRMLRFRYVFDEKMGIDFAAAEIVEEFPGEQGNHFCPQFVRLS
jgi:hypothetical protein